MNQRQWLALAVGAAFLVLAVLVVSWQFYLPEHLPAGWGPNAQRFAGWSLYNRLPARVQAANDALYYVRQYQTLYLGQCVLVVVAALITVVRLSERES